LQQAGTLGLRKAELINATRDLIMKIKLLTLLPIKIKKLMWRSIVNEYDNKEPYSNLTRYFFNNYLHEKAFFHDAINYDITTIANSPSAKLIRTNNACEGYNNRLREKIQFVHPTASYVVKALIEEEESYRLRTLEIIEKKKAKSAFASHINATLKMPVNELLNWLSESLTKKMRNNIIGDLEIEDLSLRLRLLKI